MIENGDQHSSDYSGLQDKPRPSHADYTARVKWDGHADMRGGGHFSGRLTAPLCIAGGIAKQILARRGVYVGAHLAAVGTEDDAAFPLHPTRELFDSVAAKPFPVLDDRAGERMQALILEARQDLDSVGGMIECAAIGLPAGLGDPMFDGLETGWPRRCSAFQPSRAWNLGWASARPASTVRRTTTPLLWKTGRSSPRPTAPEAFWAASPPGCL